MALGVLCPLGPTMAHNHREGLLVTRSISSSMPTFLSLLISSSTICHHNSVLSALATACFMHLGAMLVMN